ncbi:MAG: glycosyltransferase family 4 protein [Patescibacteria group bacterium]|nr:glycosyltransferase family 4 protein [Patescibacteria group bacterium]
MSTPLKILFLHHFPLWGCGSGTFVRNLALQLAKTQKVGIVCPETRTVPGVKIYPVKLPFFASFTGHPEHPGARLYHQLTPGEITKIYRSFLHYAVDAVENFGPHIIHANHAALQTWVARYLYAIYGIPYLITVHGTDLHNIELDRRYLHLSRDGVKAARQITCVSGDTRAWFNRIFKCEGKIHAKTRTIPGGIDLSHYKQSLKTDDLDEKYGIRDRKVVMFSGKLTPYKGVRYLVKAARWINGEVFVIGDGPELATLKDLARDLHLKNVHFLGHFGKADDAWLHKFYQRADVFVAPSVWDEPLGMVILEAMAYGTPVVVTRKGGIPLAVKDGINGLFIKPRNSRDIADKVNILLADDAKRNAMGEAARNIVEEKFTWDKIAAKFLYIYRAFAVGANGKTNR